MSPAQLEHRQLAVGAPLIDRQPTPPGQRRRRARASSRPASSKHSRIAATQYAKPPMAMPSAADAAASSRPSTKSATAARHRPRRPGLREHEQPAGERRRRSAAHHEHLDAAGIAVADEHHGGRRPHGTVPHPPPLLPGSLRARPPGDEHDGGADDGGEDDGDQLPAARKRGVTRLWNRCIESVIEVESPPTSTTAK